MEAVDDERLVIAAMQVAREKDLRAKMRLWRQELPDPPPLTEEAVETPKPYWDARKWRILLLIGILLLLAVFCWRMDVFGNHDGNTEPPSGNTNPVETQNTPDVPVNENKTTPATSPGKPQKQAILRQQLVSGPLGIQGLPTTDKRSGSNADPQKVNTPKSCATAALKTRNYSAAMQCLEKADSTDRSLFWLRAHAFFGLKRYDEAATHFQTLLNSTQWGVDARWNLLMCYFMSYPERQAEYRSELDKMLQDKGSGLQKKAVEWQKLVAESLPEK
jgi:tetratricopeptide (TPR) repeat protein